MEVVYERVAGLDIGKATLTLCVRTPGPRGWPAGADADVFDDDPLAAGDAGLAAEVRGDGRGDGFDLDVLEGDVLLPGGGPGGLAGQRRAHQAISRRKTEVKDAEWIAQLLECGLLRPSFVPPPDIRRLRMLIRYRVQLMADRTRGIIRLELMLEDASVKLSSVAASLTSVSARAMLAALMAGEDDPRVLADLAKGKMRRKIPALTEALTGHFNEEQAVAPLSDGRTLLRR